jgi:hypothetical protein
LKKQSQFPGGQANVTVFEKKDYEDESRLMLRKNKANSNPNNADFRLSLSVLIDFV